MAPAIGGDDSVHGDSRDRDTHHCEDIVVHADCRVVVRGKNVGKGLDRMSRGGRLPLEILPGRTRPTSAVIAAKFATECGVTVRSQMLIFPHWKEYKRKPKLRADFYGKLGQKFVMDEENPLVQHACDNHLMKQQMNQRYFLKKKKYFDPFPLKDVTMISNVPERMNNEQWCNLVDSWTDPKKHVTTCFLNCSPGLSSLARVASYTLFSLCVQKTSEANSKNRKSVKYTVVTGSRSYEVFCNGEEDAFEMFKKTHISPNPKRKYRDNVNRAIVSPPQFFILCHLCVHACDIDVFTYALTSSYACL
ncbi:hypothetical protein ACQ4PT_026992 [Festuca glaucescens]